MIRKTDRKAKESAFPIPTISDVFVHYLFGTKKFASSLVAFVNAVLWDARLGLITKAEVKNPFNLKSYEIEKETVLDILAEDENKRLYDFEVQVAGHQYFVERCLYYWAKVFSAQLTETDPYKALKPVTSIILTDFQALKEVEALHTSFGILSKDEPRYLLTNHFDMHFLRVPDKLNEQTLKLVTTPLKAWLTFFGYPNKITEAEMKSAGKKDEGVALAVKAYDEFTQNPDLRELAERREKFLRDTQARLETLSDEKWIKGKAEGLAEGLAEGENKGEVRGKIDLLLLILTKRLGPLPEELTAKISGLTDLAEIERLADVALDVPTLDEFTKQLR